MTVGPAELTPEMREQIVKGFLGYKGMPHKLAFEPERVNLESVWHPGRQEQRTNDCVIHSFNQLFGFPFYKERE
jgi:hypothetical protein